MTRMDLYEAAELRCVDCGEVLPRCLQHAAALRCHDCDDSRAVVMFETDDTRRVAQLLERRRQSRAQLVGAVA